MVLAVRTEMLGQMVDPLREHGDLDLGGSGVLRALAETLGELALTLCGQRHAAGKVAAEHTLTASMTSRCICSTSASTDSNRRSPRSRLWNATRRVSPYRSPSKSIRYASISRPRPVWNCGLIPTLTAAARPCAQAAK